MHLLSTERNLLKPKFSVSELIASVNQTLEYAYSAIEVEGEVASFKVNQGKYVFFDLKDSEGTVNCFMSVWQLRVPIEDGMKVIVSAVPKLTPWGRFSLTIQVIRPSGEGSLKKSFELLKAKLEKEGLFQPERKRILPTVPQHVGVISSTGAAGYADFMKIVEQRWGNVRFDVAQVQVQGDVAPDQMIRAIRHFNLAEQPPEVLVIIRGGGSADDLAAFNDELLVREIAASRVPTLVGVGHEVDVTLADLVADVRAATPSNAAQILVPDRQEQIRAIEQVTGGLLPRVLRALTELEASVASILQGALERTVIRLDKAVHETEATERLLRTLDPLTVLARGYALVRGELVVGGQIEVETKEAIIQAKVETYDRKK